MAGDALAYLKEYAEKAEINKKAGKLESANEFLSDLCKEDRLHPIV